MVLILAAVTVFGFTRVDTLDCCGSVEQSIYEHNLTVEFLTAIRDTCETDIPAMADALDVVLDRHPPLTAATPADSVSIYKADLRVDIHGAVLPYIETWDASWGVPDWPDTTMRGLRWLLHGN